MKTYRLIYPLLILGLLLLIWAAVGHCQQPNPSYNLPERGTITDYGPNGVTIYNYSNHGRTYNSYGANGYESQRSSGGNTTHYGPYRPSQDDPFVDNFLKSQTDWYGR